MESALKNGPRCPRINLRGATKGIILVVFAFSLAVGRTAKAESANVRDWGARCDGMTDDASAFQNAVNYIEQTGGGALILPTGYCLLDSTVNISSYQLSVEGQGKAASTIVCAMAGDCILDDNRSTTNLRGGYFSHFKLVGYAPFSTATGLHVISGGGVAHYYDDIEADGLENGILIENIGNTWSEENELRQVIASNDVFGIHLQGHIAGDSTAYSELDEYCERNNPEVEQTVSGACLFIDGTDFYHSTVMIRVNLNTNPASLSPDVIEVDNGGDLTNDIVRVFGEGGNGAPVLAVGDSSLIGGTGNQSPVIFSSDTWGEVPYLTKSYPAWTASSAVTVGETIAASCGDYMDAENAGTTGATAPTWNCGSGLTYTFGRTTRDNNIVWRDEGTYAGANGGFNMPLAAVRIDGPGGSGTAYIVGFITAAGGCFPGSIFVNPGGSSGSYVYACVAGSWSDIK